MGCFLSWRREGTKILVAAGAAVGMLLGRPAAVQAGGDLPSFRWVNPSRGTLRDWPLVTSVAFPRGHVTDPSRLVLATDTGLLPSVVRPLARWDDGSVWWARIESQADLAPRKELVAKLEMHSTERPSPPGVKKQISVTEHGGRVEVDTGRLRLRFRRQATDWIEAIALEGKQLEGARLHGLAKVNGKESPAGPVEDVVVLASGPLRALVELRGRYGHGPLVYRVRFECFAGQPFVRVLHTFEVHAEQPEVRLDRLAVVLQLPALRKPKAAIFTEGASAAQNRTVPAEFHQLDNDTFADGKTPRAGKLRGWFDLGDGHFGVTLWARWFWQQYPQGVQLERNRIVYELYSSRDRPALAGTGAAKTHEFVWAFRGNGNPLEPAELSNVPLQAEWPADAIRTTSAVPHAAVGASVAGAEFLQRLTDAWRRVERTNDREEWDDRQTVECPRDAQGPDAHERRRRGFYGMWNWGDWNYPGYHDDTKGCDAWGNLEYDLPQVLALAYIATGDQRFFEGMVASARHFMDVDRIHSQPRFPQWVGMNHPKNPLHWTFALGGVDLGHTWVEGLLSYYFLTGDDRGLEAARSIGDFLVRRLRAPLKGNPRQFGWPQIALVSLYEATRDSRFLEAAREYGRQGMERHAPDKVQDWKLGILAEGLAYTHRHTQDDATRSWLQTYAKAVLEASARSTTDARLWPAVAYVAGQSRDPKAARAALGVVGRLDFGSWAKPFTIAGRVGFAILANLGDLAKEAPPPESPPTPEHPQGSGRETPAPAHESHRDQAAE